MGNFMEILYIPPKSFKGLESEAPEAPGKGNYGGHAPTGSYKYICEKVAPDGSFEHQQEGLTIPNVGEREFKGLLPGQCICCYYRTREILEWTHEPGYLALMTPGWYEADDGEWKWWHGDAKHGRPGCSCRTWMHKENKDAQPAMKDSENLDAKEDLESQNHAMKDPENLQDPPAQENLEAQNHAMKDSENLETQPNEQNQELNGAPAA